MTDFQIRSQQSQMFLVESTLWPMGNHVAMPNPMPDPIKLTDSCPFLDLKKKPGFSFKTYQQKHLVKPHLYPIFFHMSPIRIPTISTIRRRRYQRRITAPGFRLMGGSRSLSSDAEEALLFIRTWPDDRTVPGPRGCGRLVDERWCGSCGDGSIPIDTLL